MTMRSRCSSTNSQVVRIGRTSASAPTAAAAPRRAGSRQSPGRNRREAAVSITPDPSALAMVTLPARAASTSPATPSVESRAQFQRIAVAVVESPEDDVDRLQAVERLDEDAPIPHRQIASLDQREPEIARQVGVLEVGLVQRTRREQHDARRVARAGARAVSVSRCAQKNEARRSTWQSRNASGRLRDSTMRFSSVYPAPDGACVRSASTHQCPSGDRARSTACRWRWMSRGTAMP